MLSQGPQIKSVEAVQKRLKHLVSAVQKNEDAREKHKDYPPSFLDSEVELDDAINVFGQLASKPNLLEVFLNGDGVTTLASLVQSHPNPDIAQSAVAVIGELADPENFGEQYQALQKAFANALIDQCDWLNVLNSHIQRFINLNSEDDYEAVSVCFQCLSHTLELDMPIGIKALIKNQPLVTLLFDQSEAFDEHALYASEIIADVVAFAAAHESQLNENCLQYLAESKAKSIISILAKETRRDRFSSAEHEEVLLSLTDALTVLLSEKRDALEDTEAMPVVMSYFETVCELNNVALKLLPILLPSNASNCQFFIEHKGLKTLFAVLRSTTGRTLKKLQTVASVALIIEALIINCQGDDLGRIISKLVAKDLAGFREVIATLNILLSRIEEADTEALSEIENYPCAIEWDKQDLTLNLEPDALAAELELYSNVESMLEVAGIICRIVVRLFNVGDRLLKIGLHHYLSSHSLLLKKIPGTLKRLTYFNPGVDWLIPDWRDIEAQHDDAVNEGRRKLEEFQQTIEIAQQKDAEKERSANTERNREMRQKHKIRRMDAEMARLTRIEESRYLHKKNLR